jgi:hypothetical protein
LICSRPTRFGLDFEHDDSSLVFDVSEEQPGFQEFKEYMERRFSFPPDWWEKVLRPAFGANESVVFVRTA